MTRGNTLRKLPGAYKAPFSDDSAETRRSPRFGNFGSSAFFVPSRISYRALEARHYGLLKVTIGPHHLKSNGRIFGAREN
jgi:hypothetical protein